MTNTLNPSSTKPLWLVEFYTVSSTGVRGWDINFAWVRSDSRAEARARVAKEQGGRFDTVLTTEHHSHIVALHGDFRVNTADANLFIYE